MPAASSARMLASNVDPVVSTSSRSTTRALTGGAADRRRRTRPARLAARAAASSPTESWARPAVYKQGETPANTPYPAIRPAAALAIRVTGSPPRRRAAARRLGAGTIQSWPGSNAARRNRSKALPTALPMSGGRSVRPCSFPARIAARTGPEYRVMALIGGSAIPAAASSVASGSRTSRGRTSSVDAHPAHHCAGPPHPGHGLGSTRSRAIRTGFHVAASSVVRPCNMDQDWTESLDTALTIRPLWTTPGPVDNIHRQVTGAIGVQQL